MQIFKEKAALAGVVEKVKSEKLSIGFVPTMGALHEGHLSLVRQAYESCEVVVVSIFINPTQFNNPADLENYPRTLDQDLEKLAALKIDKLLIFVPSASELYGNLVKSQHFNFEGLENKMEGKFRAGHFDGVGTIVKRLFELVKPDKAFFGEKDYQQLQVIRKMVKNEGL
ncbi:MAG: pantoate--beta-alanine ligase, partial [Gillisia sp.]